MVRIDSHLLKVLRDGGYSTSDIEEIKRRLNAEPHYLAALRDEFAKAAMQGLLYDTPGYECSEGQRVCDAVAKDAYNYADAMLAARGKGGAA